MKFSIDRAKYIDTGLVSEKEHPHAPYLIYNYTPACQFTRSWDDVTKMCRGLIVHKETGEILARPFTKFFNYEEHVEKGDKLPDEEPVVYKKMDGSLGILYWINDRPFIATRGSFVSDQAKWASAYILMNEIDLSHLNRDYTYLFEIIYPENRIVVSYGDREALVFLAAIETETGKTVEMQDCSPFKSAGCVPFIDYETLKSLNTPNEEGFILHYPKADMRVKIKFEDYVKLHKVMTGLSQIGIWEMLRDGKSIMEVIKDIPDEMHTWVQSVVTGLMDKYLSIERIASQAELGARRLSTRKEQAEVVKECPYPGVAFAMLDGKDYKQNIWRMIRPKGSVTFRVDIDS